VPHSTQTKNFKKRIRYKMVYSCGESLTYLFDNYIVYTIYDSQQVR